MIDLLRWGMDVDYPTKVSSNGGRYRYKDDWETPDTQLINLDFKNGTSMLGNREVVTENIVKEVLLV